MAGNEYEGRYIVLIKPIKDKKLQYVLAKKLNELIPRTSFVSFKERLARGESVVILRTDSFAKADKHRSIFEALGVEVVITEQATIGGAEVF